MTDWKKYTITKIYFNKEYIRFYFDIDLVCNYRNSYNNDNIRFNFLDVPNSSPYNTCHVGDCLEIDSDVTKRWEKDRSSLNDNSKKLGGCYTSPWNWVRKFSTSESDIFKDAKELRSNVSRLESNNYNLKKELDKQNYINRELVSMLNNFSQRMLGNNETFTSNSYFTEYELSNCRQKLNRIVDESEISKKEQTALVIRNSTDLSVTKETLKLTQVANLALQKQISDNKDDYQQKLEDKDKQIKDKNDQIKQGLELYKNKEDEVKDLNKKSDELKDKNTELREENSVTKAKLQRSKEEIDELRKKVGQSEEEFLESKIRLKQERLELFADRLEVNLEKIQTLREYFEERINARSGNDRKEVEKKITQTKQEFRSKIKMEDVQEICSRCEEIAELQIKLEKLHEQQFEAKQEIPTNQ